MRSEERLEVKGARPKVSFIFTQKTAPCFYKPGQHRGNFHGFLAPRLAFLVFYITDVHTNVIWVRSSPQEPFAYEKKLILSFIDSLSNPSAMLLGMESPARVT
jgi:hypothetical protein